MTNEITELTLAELSDALNRKAISSVEATSACLAQIEHVQPAVNCFISVEPDEALHAARMADEYASKNPRKSALHGIPLAHKDMFYREGKVTTCGSKIRRDFVPDTTATVMKRLSGTGAVNLGRLNLAEFACGPTGHNEHFGNCTNPWNTDHISGGSSSGSGAAVAARAIYGSLGSDTGGSLRLPSAICGVTGLKPTYGRISRYGVMPRCWSLDVVGPIARTAKDCALLLQEIAGADCLDSSSLNVDVPNYHSFLTRDIRGLKIGIPSNRVFSETDTDIRRILDDSLTVLKDLGADIMEIDLPDPENIYHLTNVINKAEAATIHKDWLRDRPEDYSLSVRSRLEAGLFISATEYLDAIRMQGRVLAEFVRTIFSRVEFVHMPVLGIPVPTVKETQIHTSDGVPQMMEKITRYTRWVSYLGLPALAVPCGFTNNGLPVAFQLLGKPFAEGGLLQVGDAYQSCTDWHTRSPYSTF